MEWGQDTSLTSMPRKRLSPGFRNCPVNTYGRAIAPVKLHSVSDSRESQCFGLGRDLGNSGVYTRLRAGDVRTARLEDRQGFTAFASSNVTLSAKLERTASDVIAAGSPNGSAWTASSIHEPWDGVSRLRQYKNARLRCGRFAQASACP